MSMFKDDSYNDGLDTGKRIAAGCVAASVIVLIILAVTFTSNSRNRRNNHTTNLATVSAQDTEKAEYEIGREKRTSDELSFWNMYDEEEETVISANDTRERRQEEEKPVKDKAELYKERAEQARKTKEESASENQIVSENRFNVKGANEEPQYVPIDPMLQKSTLNGEGFKLDDKGRMSYQSDGRTTSRFGIDVSKYNGKVSWNAVKKEGVEFAMIRVGARGYSSGKVMLDETFRDNVRGCLENGIDIGLYFFSQAVTQEEAVEEANYCLAAIGGVSASSNTIVKYPIVFDSEAVANDNYRTQYLSPEDLSSCAMAFCEQIKAYGYTPMIAGTKEQLAVKMDLSLLQNYELWLFDMGEKSEFPYRYSIRQYTNRGKLDGISTPVDYDICLISYEDR